MNFRIYSIEEIGEIEKDTMGYIDLEGNFWSLGKAKRMSWGGFYESSFEGMGEIADLMAKTLLKDTYKEYLETSDLNKKHYLPYFWPADKILLSLGFCRFYRGYYDRDDSYVELSVYKNANVRQLFVMNYLFALNSMYASTDMEKERNILMKKLMQK